MPVETIELVVHPLFRYIAEYRTPESRGAVFRYNKAEREIVKNRLSNFGRLIKKVAADDKSVLCIVPAGEYDVKVPQIQGDAIKKISVEKGKERVNFSIWYSILGVLSVALMILLMKSKMF